MFFYEIWNDTLFLKDKNMKFLKVTILAFIVVAFTSCDCLQHIQGVVVDSETRLPINKVMVEIVMAKEHSRNRPIYTDSLGNFEITSMTGGILGCPKISLSLEKEGYNKVKKKYKCCTGNVVIALKRQAEGKTEKR